VREARDARRAALEVLTHSLAEEDGALLTEVDGTNVSVKSKTTERYQSVSSEIADTMREIWLDVEVLERHLLDSPDPIKRWTEMLLATLPPPTRTRSVLVKPIATRATDDEEEGAAQRESRAPSAETRELVACVVRSERIIKNQAASAADERKAKLTLKKQAEEALVQELSSDANGRVLRCDLVERDARHSSTEQNRTESYYVRLDAPKAGAARRIGVRALRKKITETLNLFESVAPGSKMSTRERVRRLSEPQFGDDFCASLKAALTEMESSRGDEKRCVVVNKVRQPRASVSGVARSLNAGVQN
jgi:hypothetical protein